MVSPGPGEVSPVVYHKAGTNHTKLCIYIISDTYSTIELLNASMIGVLTFYQPWSEKESTVSQIFT